VVSWGILIAGVAVLPGVSILFGSLLVLQRAERVAFCASCHVAMKPYVDDMEDPASQSLAAVHFRNRYIPKDQCYSCHTSFGMFGDVQAKWAGMIDVHKYYTRSFRFPLKMREPYPNTDCLKCHGESQKWSPAHTESKDDLFRGKVSCLECHAQAHLLKGS
jgi:nitrate/TMAO reductase-like tetraheme cytochrome c subunit